MKPKNQWIKFSSPDQTGDFQRAVYQIFEPVRVRLSSGELPFFIDYWLNVLNTHDCSTLFCGDEPRAFVAVPKLTEVHFERWFSPILGVSSSFEGLSVPEWVPPDKVYCVCADQLSRNSFLTAFPGIVSFMSEDRVGGEGPPGISGKVIQSCFAVRGSDVPPAKPVQGLVCSPLETETLEGTLALIRKEYVGEFLPEYYIPILRRNVAEALETGSGWSFVASDSASCEVVGFALYFGFSLPLCGLPCALTADLVVRPDWRGRGVAPFLQNYSYSAIGAQGVNWFAGNVFAGNCASVRQMMKLGRVPWSHAVRPA